MMTIIHFQIKAWRKMLFVFTFCTILTACQSKAIDTNSVVPFFPQQQISPSVFMDALLVGKLVLVGSCLRVEDNNNNYVLIWPQGFSLKTADKFIQISDGAGNLVAQVGDNINVSGGEILSEQIGNYVSQTLPNDCSGPYWIVASVEK